MSDGVETNEVSVFNRDEVLGKIDGLLQIKDEGQRSKETAEFVDERLALLSENSVARGFSVMSRARKGFLHPEAGVKRNFLVDPFNVDDPEVYKQLIQTLGEFRQTPGWEGKTLREVAPNALLRTVGLYYGNLWSGSNTEKENREFYSERMSSDSEPVHLNELKGKGFAVCAEKAALTQNLLSFLGYESELVASTKCRLENPDEDDRSGHMYNVITSGENHLIFDPTNSIRVTNEDGSMHNVLAAFYPINSEEYKSLMSGGQVEVLHHDAKWDGQQIKPEISGQRRVYGGPDPSALV